MQAAAAGRDPCSDKRESWRAEKDSDSDLIAHHVETFLARHVRPKNKAKTIAETERRFNKYILPRWGERSVQEIRRRDVIGLLDAIVDQGAPVSANRVSSPQDILLLLGRSVCHRTVTDTRRTSANCRG